MTFEKVLVYSQNASGEEWGLFEAGNISGWPETRCWLRIIFV